MSFARVVRSATLVVALANSVGNLGCSRNDSKAQRQPAAAVAAPGSADSAGKAGPASPTGSEEAGRPKGIPVDDETLRRAVNPRGEPPYGGKTGTVRGKVTLRGGEDAPILEDVLAKVPADCKEARDFYARPFRTGAGGALADALVAVTEYSRYVPAAGEARVVVARDCTWDTRTIAVTFGQRLDVVSKDGRGYIPKLLGTKTPAQLVVIPGGAPIPLHPMEPGHYVLIDSGKEFMQADVLVLKYATFDVTGLDGKFEIQGVPVGEVSVNALLPATMATQQQRIRVQAGEVHELNFELSFDRQQFEQAQRSPDAGGGTTAPAPSR